MGQKTKIIKNISKNLILRPRQEVQLFYFFFNVFMIKFYQKNQNYPHQCYPQAYNHNQMQENSIELNLLHQQISTVQHQSIMNKQFVQIYKKALSYSNCKVESQLHFRNVVIHDKEHIHEVYTNNKKLPHLVMLHGYGGTSLTFVRTFQHLKDHFQIHALDTFGVGLSSRGKWKDQFTPEEAGQYYIQAVQQWRKKTKIQQFYLAGHSFGGYISTLYLQKYPKRVKQLVLLSPAGSGKLTTQQIQQRAKNRSFFFCIAQKVYNWRFRPSRVMNSWYIGNKFIEKILNNRLKLPEQQQQVWKQYLKHISQIEQSSQTGFYSLFSWPLQPYRSIQQILNGIKPKIKIDFLYGDSDWMNQDGAKRLVKDYEHMNHHIIQSAGHQLIFDNPKDVTDKLIEVINH